MPISGDDSPEELVTKILVRLEVKSVVRCKSVWKSWLSIITNRSFTKSHLNTALIASKTNPTLLVIEYPTEHFAPNYNLDDVSHVRIDSVVMPRRFVSLPGSAVVGTSNGIMCLDFSHGSAVYLWNPSIHMCHRVWAPSLSMGPLTYKLGFCYDSISDDYKVVRIVYEDLNDDFPTVQVYSTNTRCWIPDPVLRKWKPKVELTLLVNGVRYLDYKDKLVSFDFHKKVFGLVPFPDSIFKKRSDVLVYDGTVAMAFESVGDIGQTISS